MLKNNKNALIVFIKNPIRGKVKTRIAATMGEEAALMIYRKLLRHTQQVALSVSVTRFLYYGDFILLNDKWDNGFQKRLQTQHADLGERMGDAFGQVFAEKYEKVVIIGSDCALLTPNMVQNAFDQLDAYDFVIGPATDGGYYLLGMCAAHSDIFKNIIYSTDSVLQKTIENIDLLQKTTFLLPTLSDTDDEKDWEKVKAIVM
jgi:rSAM/selenodomain-associated transferase 1